MAVIGYKAETKDERRKERRRDREVVRGREGRAWAWAALRIFRALGAVTCPLSDSRFLVRKVGGVNGGWEN